MNEQKCEFEQRRLAVMRKHHAHDPKLKVLRRQRKRAVFVSVVGSCLVIGAVMVLLKSFVIAHEGQAAYARMVAPAMQGQAESSIIARALGPDPVSTELAAVIAPFLPRQTTASRGTDAFAASRDAPVALPEAADRP